MSWELAEGLEREMVEDAMYNGLAEVGRAVLPGTNDPMSVEDASAKFFEVAYEVVEWMEAVCPPDENGNVVVPRYGLVLLVEDTHPIHAQIDRARKALKATEN